jgi:hypothetical protein
MPGEEAHRGAEVPGLTATQTDARVERITELLLEADPWGQSVHRPIRDHTRALGMQRQQLGRDNPITIGVVVHAMPHVNWYKVQLGDGGGWVGCQKLSGHNCIPLGPRQGNVVGSGSRVLVWKHPNIDFGVILGVLPHAIEDPRAAVPGWLSQGAATGVKREGAHLQLFKGMFADGGVQDFSCSSPVDATSMDLCYVTETGLCLLVSPFELMFRVNEMCGLFLNYFDSHATLAGWNLNLLSSCHETVSGHDEGENRHRAFTAVYPWESVGLAHPGQQLAADFDAKAVQYSAHKGAVDLPDGGEDAQPIYRVQHYGGYEGQGGVRAVVLPSVGGPRTFAGAAVGVDETLFGENVGLDGSLTVHSAKGLLFVKRVKAPWPREAKPAESGGGDDAAADNYKFSSFFGGGPDHKIGDVAAPAGSDAGLLRVAGVQDLIAHAVNWKRLHPFHYRRDFVTPQASADGNFERTTDVLAFDDAAGNGYLRQPTPVFLNVDHRYSQVAYYLRESFFAMLEDGNVVLGGGAGERLAFVDGKIRLDCPGDVEICPGRDFVLQSGGCVIKAQDSVDVSSSRKDVRLWANNNLQIGSAGSLLIDGQGTSTNHLYKDRVGEDVEAGGVVIRSKGQMVLMGDSVYCRSLAGDVVLDADQMNGDVVLTCSAVNVLQQGDFTIWHFSGPDGEVQESHRFSQGTSHHQGDLVIGGSAYVGAEGPASLTVIGGVRATRSVSCGGRVADSRGGALGRVNDTFVSDLEQLAQPLAEGIRLVDSEGDAYKTIQFDDGLYGQGGIGSAAVIQYIGFSYRDGDDPGRQYGTKNMRFLESRWQTIARLGGGTGGAAWQENPVLYQGRELYPWPGRVAWAGDGFLQVEQLTMYDAAAGRDRDRPGPYENASLGGEQLTSMQQGVKVITRQ